MLPVFTVFSVFMKNYKREEFPTVQSRNFSCALKKVFLCTVINSPYLSSNNQGLFQYKTPPLFFTKLSNTFYKAFQKVQEGFVTNFTRRCGMEHYSRRLHKTACRGAEWCFVNEINQIR
jgi:hypothetical protein